MFRFKISIKTKKIYRLGNPIEIVVKLKNNTKRDYFLLTRDTPFESIHSNCFHLKLNGEDVPYDSIIVKRKEISENSFLILPGKKTIKFKIALAERYLFGKSGKVQLRYVPKLHFTELIENHKGKLLGEEPQVIKKTFYLLKGKSPYPTVGMELRQEEKGYLAARAHKQEAVDGFQEPDIIYNCFIHPREQENVFKSAVKESHYEMLHYLIHCLTELKSEEKGNNLHYKMVFGNYEENRYKKVEDSYSKIFNAASSVIVYKRNERFTYPDPKQKGNLDEECDGYRVRGCDTVFLCKPFMDRAVLSGEDCRMGILLHELSHIYANTVDYRLSTGETCYGRKLCRELAGKNPDAAITNADSYEFFLESKFLNWMPEEVWPGCEDIDTDAHGGPSAVLERNSKILLFYKSNAGILKMAESDGTTFNPPADMTDSEGNAIQAECQPEGIIFGNTLFLFYIPKGKKTLYYTKWSGNKWFPGIPVSYTVEYKGKETEIEIKPMYVPHPVIYQNELTLVYRKEEEETLFITSWNGRRWMQEKDIPDSTYFAKTVTYNPGVTVYEGILYVIYICYGSKEINYACYNPGTESWSMDHKIIVKMNLKSQEAEYAEAYSEILAIVKKDIMQVIFTDKYSSIMQLQMNYNEYLKCKVWTDYEPAYISSVDENDPQAGSLCSYVDNGRYGYLIYKGRGNSGIYISRKMSI